jgi:hypothetical protein
MEEYLKAKEKAAALGKPAVKTVAATKTLQVKDVSESSDKYTDEDFDSISKS